MPNQSTRFVFAATAAQRIGLGATGTTFTPSSVFNLPVNVQRPDGSNLASVTCGNSTSSNTAANCGVQFVANVTGTYTLTVDSQGNSKINTSVMLTSPATGTLSADTGQAVSLARAGQGATYTFAANTGDSLALDVSAATLTPQQASITLQILKPDGSTLNYCSQTPPNPFYCELGTLATSGTYTVVASTYYGMPGAFTLTLKQGPTLLSTDSPAAFATANASESTRARYAATAGQLFSVGISSLAYVSGGGNSTVVVYSPNGAQANSNNCNPAWYGGICTVLVKNPVAGTYSISIQPPPSVKITGNVQVSAALSGSLTASTPVSLSATRTGQIAAYTFSGTAGDSTSIKLFGVTTTPANQGVGFEMDRPDTSFVTGSTATTTSPAIASILSLPVTGTYTVLVYQTAGYPWSGTLELDPGALLTLNASPTTLTNSAPGEPVRYRINMSGQELDFGLTGLTYSSGSGSSTVTMTATNGYSLPGFGCNGGGNCDAYYQNLGTGAASIIIMPPYNAQISGGSVYLSTPVTGSLTIGGAAQPVSITVPGQVARYSFSGTTGQTLHLSWSSASVSGSGTVYVSVLNSQGYTQSSSSFVDGATGGYDLPALGGNDTYTVLLDPVAAATMSVSISLVTR